MNTLIETLMAILQQEVDVFRRLLEALGREQEGLMRHNIEVLELAVEEQKGITREAAVRERERQSVVHQLAGILQESPEELSLRRLIGRVQEPFRSQLQGFRETLVELQDQIRKANRQNTLLIKQSLKYVDKSLQILAGSGPAAGVYESSGRVENPTSNSLSGVVNQIV